ncbi:sulfite exporter TauE/SafE family protein [Vibrio vulnificus]|uniref:sulfite exporter TauE/SafE family protein n=1 Tax=Vibrio vulnificus TaxID=672 RepID=UPI000D41A7EA|nr:sulfite exporter TauE/SafE family protein [Vibrio vulnificus]EHZ7343449.1 sulfite exporter TauE/SafE family protein [Vibrio vulnificus]ELE1961589.1 sulfite exporter TauE/SafE family protein [Vibrio vulnificus]ELL0597341.1 sulfite exporter TauE/SafE family protein [Vibrio vulnificus]ELV8700105.1 sulfite exporter TauE/SafE family protein [Vibrio vulnificus]ELV8812584.1 sulfite exporter TauE/SafE family protein [Vibrio vulnificus]
MDWISTLFLFFGSLIANTLASLAGGGAGLLQFPLLIFLGLPFGVALATHKLASVALGLGAAYTHLKSGKIKLTTAFYLILTGSISVIIGANIVLMIPSDIAEFMLGIMILLLGVYSRFKKQLGQEEKPRNRDLSGWLLGGVGLLLIGIINGSLTAGSGLLVTLFLVRWFGYDYKQAVALTLICVGFFWNGIGGIAVVQAGAPVHWPWLPILLASSFLGGALGAWMTNRYSNRTVKIVFELLTFAVGLKLLF